MEEETAKNGVVSHSSIALHSTGKDRKNVDGQEGRKTIHEGTHLNSVQVCPSLCHFSSAHKPSCLVAYFASLFVVKWI